MRKFNYFIPYTLVVIFQLLICTHLHVSQYLMLSVLPVIVLLIPLRYNTVVAMLVAFATGLLVDLLADGVIGLNALALVPVALIRKPLIARVFGTETFARQVDISLSHYGYLKFTISLVMVQLLFLLIYVIVDSAGARSVLFCSIRIAVSLVVGVLVALAIASVLAHEDRG